jgi:hypothetical protein
LLNMARDSCNLGPGLRRDDTFQGQPSAELAAIGNGRGAAGERSEIRRCGG